MAKKSTASVVVYTLMILSIILMLTQQLIRSVYVGSHFVQTMVEREQAEMLALSGINVAIAQLTHDHKKSKKAAEKTLAAGEKEEDEQTGIRKFLLQVLPHLNRWNDYQLKESIDGVEGTIRICITCEQGKININEAFDFTKMEFKKEYEALLRGLEIRGRIPAGEMVTRMTEFFKKRKRKLDDISELQSIPGLQSLNIFYRPPSMPAKGKKSEPNTELTLQDIFTIWTDNDKVDSLWLSDSLCAMFGLRRPHADDATARGDRFKQFAQSFTKDQVQDWEKNWKALESLYDQKPKVHPEIKNIFSKEFGPKVFSVLSCGKVGRVEQFVLAVIRQEKTEQTAEEGMKEKTPEEKAESSKKGKKMFRLLRVYWL